MNQLEIEKEVSDISMECQKALWEEHKNKTSQRPYHLVIRPIILAYAMGKQLEINRLHELFELQINREQKTLGTYNEFLDDAKLHRDRMRDLDAKKEKAYRDLLFSIADAYKGIAPEVSDHINSFLKNIEAHESESSSEN